MKPGDRLLIVEMLVERFDRDNFGSFADLQMMTVCSNGRERSVGELQALVAASGFEPARVFRYPTTGIVEARAV